MTIPSNNPTLSINWKPAMPRQTGLTRGSLLEANPRREATAFEQIVLSIFAVLASAILIWAIDQYAMPPEEIIQSFAFMPLP